jgi:hypothetical protein
LMSRLLPQRPGRVARHFGKDRAKAGTNTILCLVSY